MFHLESADGLTYDQAVLSCQEHGGILASTGELYAAWKTGFDKCRAGWLQDGSVRYPINIPRARCGGGKHGVHTVYAHPNQTGFPPREDRYDAYCIRSELLVQKNTLYEQYQHQLINTNCCTSTVNILLTANETGPNATDIHNKQLNHTSVADSFRLCKVSLPNVHRKDSFLLQNSHCLFYMSPQLSPLLFPLSMWRCLALVQAQKTLPQSLQEDAFL